MWDLIVSVPDHYLSFYFSNCKTKFNGQKSSFSRKPLIMTENPGLRRKPGFIRAKPGLSNRKSRVFSAKPGFYYVVCIWLAITAYTGLTCILIDVYILAKSFYRPLLKLG